MVLGFKCISVAFTRALHVHLQQSTHQTAQTGADRRGPARSNLKDILDTNLKFNTRIIPTLIAPS